MRYQYKLEIKNKMHYEYNENEKGERFVNNSKSFDTGIKKINCFLINEKKYCCDKFKQLNNNKFIGFGNFYEIEIINIIPEDLEMAYNYFYLKFIVVIDESHNTKTYRYKIDRCPFCNENIELEEIK